MKTLARSLVLAAVVAASSAPSRAQPPAEAPTARPPQPMLGQAAPAFQLKDLKGNTVSLASLEGKIVVLHFGASW